MVSESNKWSSVYVASSFLSNIGHGLLIALVGPTQPYLAQNVGVKIDTINFVWSFGFIGYLLGSLLSGLVFKRYFTGEKTKLTVLTLTIGLSGLGMCFIPFIKSFTLLVTIRMIQNFILGAYITADASMLVFTMGPVKSRPFTNALHAAVGVGFFMSSWVVRPFLPDDSASSKDRDVVCNILNGTSGSNDTLDHLMESSPPVEGDIVTPYLITGVFCVMVSLGYLILGCFLPWTMPRFYEDATGDIQHGGDGNKKIRSPVVMFVFVFIYYFISCGIERIYQPMAYTFGYCGPLKLPSSVAVLIDSTYNGGFLAGRLVSVGVALCIRPRNMIISSCLMCITASVLLCVFGSTDKYGLFAGTALLGFFVSWQFGSCYSFVAKKVDITGWLSPLFFIGCGLGSAVFPPLSGFVFTSSLGPSSILYLTLITSVIQCFVFGLIYFFSRKTEYRLTSQELK